jgi:hypothetical protein
MMGGDVADTRQPRQTMSGFRGKAAVPQKSRDLAERAPRRDMIKNQIFKFRETARREPEIRIRFGCGGQKKQGFHPIPR